MQWEQGTMSATYFETVKKTNLYFCRYIHTYIHYIYTYIWIQGNFARFLKILSYIKKLKNKIEHNIVKYKNIASILDRD